jgi:glycosyltransferase involved in cell wall biosynthesis
MDVPAELEWELIVVDNNSTDDTAAICKQSATLVRYVFEPEQGQSAARNRGIAEANSDVILFTDDDVDVDSKWLVNHWKAMQRHPQVAFCGGRVVPKWETPPPRWLEDHSRGALRGVSLHFDLGADERELGNEAVNFVGANLGFRKSLLTKAGVKFRNDVGLKGGGNIRGDELWLLRQLVELGYRGVYVPSAIVNHRNPPERMTRAYVRDWFKGEGRAAVRMGDSPPSSRNWFGAPRYLWRQFFSSAIKLMMMRPFYAPTKWLPYECQMASKWGSICEFRDVARRGAKK